MSGQLIFRIRGKDDKGRVEKDPELRRKRSESREIITIGTQDMTSLLFCIVVFILTEP